MARKPAINTGDSGADEVTQAEPTRPQPRDAAGRPLDEFGLPMGGPARLKALGDRTDPRIDPKGWARVAVPDPEPSPPPATPPAGQSATPPETEQ